ncbi:MAG: M1 family peptidase, partial [Nonomuraea sp.]|nr:M1 family peptidase [Nonomuraea sp.]
MRRPLLLLLSVILAVPACTAEPVTPAPATATRTSAAPAAQPPPPVDLSAYVKGRSRPVADPVYPAYGDPSID